VTRALAWAACALSLACLAPRAPAQEPSRVRALLERCADDSVDRTASDLRALGAEGVRECLEAILRSELERRPAAKRAALAVLAGRAEAVRAAIAPLLDSGASTESRARGLEALAAAGTLEDLELAISLATSSPAATGPDGEPCVDPDVLDRLQACTSTLFAREPDEIPRAQARIERCPGALAPALVAALGETGTPQGLALLGELLSRGTPHASSAVAAIATAAKGLPPPFDLRVRDAVRWTLERETPEGFREAVICVGWLEDDRSAALLVDLLDHASAGVRADALWSLRRITGARIEGDRERWSRWLDAEDRWRAERLPAMLASLETGAPAERAAALNEVLRHSFPRHEIALELALRVGRLDGAAFAAACEALAKLGSRAALPPLLELRGEAPDPAALDRCLAILAGPDATVPAR
jgi:hypothetical protein